MIGFINSQIYQNGIFQPLNIYTEDGVIVEVTTESRDCDQVYDLSGMMILPGLVDTHVHFRGGNQSYKETFYTGSRVARKGGVTYVGDMPNNDQPIITLERLRKKEDVALRDSVVNFGLYAAVTPESLPYLAELAPYVLAFKLFMGESTGGINYLYDELEEAFERVARTEKLLCVHAEDQNILDEAKREYQDDLRPVAHILARPPEAEIEAIGYALKLAKDYELPLHFCHVSTKGGVELIREAKDYGLNVTAETCPHYLFMTLEDLLRLGPYAKMNPPLRSYEDQEALWEAIEDGTLISITSDHAPHTKEEKNRGLDNIWGAPSGIPGVETTLPLMLNAVYEGRLTLSQLVELMHDNPVVRFSLGRYGYIEEGNDANLTVIDPTREWMIENDKLLTKCGWSPYHGWSGVGSPVGVVVNGRVNGLGGYLVRI